MFIFILVIEKKVFIFKKILIKLNHKRLLIIKIDILRWTIKIDYNCQKHNSAKINYLVKEKKPLIIKLALYTWNYYINNKKKILYY